MHILTTVLPRFTRICAAVATIACLAGTCAYAQPSTPVNDPLPVSFLPQSPTTATFQRFDKQALVNLTTGAAQAGVPIAEVHGGSLKTEVSLQYTFGGLRVFQPKDLIGLGWSLQAGGSITRHVVGRLDEDASGFGPYNTDYVSTHYADPLFLKAGTEGNADPAPDFYELSVGSLNCRFILKDTTITLLPQQRIQIRKLHDNAGFQLATESGVRYLFAEAEVTVPNPHNFGTLGAHTSSWQLTSIISAGNTDTIHFHYSPWSYLEKTRIGQTSMSLLISLNAVPVEYTDQAPHNSWVYGSHLYARLLDSITTRGTHVLIQRDAEKIVQQVLTLSTSSTSRRLIRTIGLGHSYFTGIPNQPERRLRLDWVQELNGPLQLPAYSFSYNSAYALPPTTSCSQDHWGYYNGVSNNGDNNSSALLPHPRLEQFSANRNPNFDYALAGALQRITFPTGGYTTFLYEPNRYAIVNKMQAVNASFGISAPLTSLRHLDGTRLLPLGTYGSYLQLPGDSIAFTISEPTTVKFKLLVRPLIAGNNNFLSKRSDFFLLKETSAGDSVISRRSGIADQVLNWEQPLHPGRYMAWVISESELKYGPDFAEDGNELQMLLPRQVYTPDVAGNGVRVRQTVSATGAGAPPLIHRFSYQLDTPMGPCSSGIMLLPITDDGQPTYRFTPYQQPRRIGGYANAVKLYFNFSSDISRFGDEYQKCSFYYSRVTEEEGEIGGANGRTVSYYTHWPKQFNQTTPTRTETYRTSAGTSTPVLVQLQRTHYVDIAAPTSSFLALRPFSRGNPPSSNPYVPDREEVFEANYFNVEAGLFAPDSSVTIRYDGTGNSSVSITKTTYKQQRPVRSITHTNNGNQRIDLVTYLTDYSSALPDITSLRANNFNPVIEIQHWVKFANGKDSVLTGGEATLFHPRWQRPVSIWRLNIGYPQVGLNSLQVVNNLRQSWLSDTHYQLIATEQYATDTGDPVEHKVTAGIPTAYVWGYQRTLLTAQVQNATPAQVAYTGFEVGDMGRWQGVDAAITAPGYTGDAGYDLSNGLACQGLPPGTYRLSYRRQGTNSGMTANGQLLTPTGPARAGWTEYASMVSIGVAGSVQVVGTGHIDDVRLHPIGARMTSYTHAPLVGETSQTDPSGRTVTYEYDTLGRLVRTRDEQGRILSQQQYHYARP